MSLSLVTSITKEQVTAHLNKNLQYKNHYAKPRSPLTQNEPTLMGLLVSEKPGTKWSSLPKEMENEVVGPVMRGLFLEVHNEK